MGPDFRGEVASYYARYRRGYPPPAVDAIAKAFGLGGIAVVTNGTPLWLQDTEWSRSLRQCLEQWTERPQTGPCQTDEAGRALNRQALMAAGYRVTESTVEYETMLTIDQVIGGMFSAMSPDQLSPRSRREELATQVRQALARYEPLTEHVRVWLQFGHVP